MSLSITHASIDDLDALVPLFDAYRQFYQQSSDLDGARKYLHERLIDGEAVVFLAWEDLEAIGFALLYPTYTSVSMRFFWILNDLYVKPEMRKQGIGRALLERSKTHGRETGAQRLQLRTAITNTAAQSVYEAHGWKRDTVFFTYTLTL